MKKHIVAILVNRKAHEDLNKNEDRLKDYRQYLVETQQKISENYDKTIITLAGGALGTSLAFIKDIIGQDPVQAKYILSFSWIMLTASLASVASSLYYGTKAFGEAIKQVDGQNIYGSTVGGWTAKVTGVLHTAGLALLVIGLLALGLFVHINI